VRRQAGVLARIGGVVVVAGFLLAAGLARFGGGGGYQATFVFPDAANLITGSRVQVDGFSAGRVTDLSARDGRALVQVTLDGDHAPLRAGTTARIAYRSLLGERVVEITPAPAGNAAIPDGGMITDVAPRVELDQLIDTMDPETRAAVSRLLPALDRTLAGHEDDVGATLEATGPAVDALTDVLRAVGEDGPALRQLLTAVRALSERLVARREAVRDTVDGFERNMTAMARQDEALRAALDDLPATLRQADAALARVPGAARAAVPLLGDLRSATEAMPEAARDLRPFLAELGPTLDELQPTVVSLGGLLTETPGLLDHVHTAVPGASTAVAALLPALDFLRPYTPEIAGLFANFGSAAANYDANGQYVRVFVSGGSASGVGSPLGPSPSVRSNPQRAPGELEGQPVDAAGSRVR
jgi:phospholipid/cholesterol/gamma-HCH transport system substrate-binding protein